MINIINQLCRCKRVTREVVLDTIYPAYDFKPQSYTEIKCEYPFDISRPNEQRMKNVVCGGRNDYDCVVSANVLNNYFDKFLFIIFCNISHQKNRNRTIYVTRRLKSNRGINCWEYFPVNTSSGCDCMWSADRYGKKSSNIDNYWVTFNLHNWVFMY